MFQTYESAIVAYLHLLIKKRILEAEGEKREGIQMDMIIFMLISLTSSQLFCLEFNQEIFFSM